MKLIFNKPTFSPPGAAVSGVDFAYRGTAVFHGLTVAMPPGTFTAVIGSNGCGKSTLLGLLAGVLHADRGVVTVDSSDVAFAVQRSSVTDSFPVTVGEAVMMGRWRRLGLLRRPKSDDRAAVEHWLTELGLADLRRRTLGELSGGQRQRVLLAQAFAQEASLLLLDEPTTGLDADTALLVVAHLRRLADAGTTVISATHDKALMSAADHRIDLDEQAVALG